MDASAVAIEPTVRLVVECRECGQRWTVDVTGAYGPELDRRALCEQCCAETGATPEI